MDALTHALSGAIIAFLLPETTETDKILIIGGSLAPDIFTLPYLNALAKKVKKKIIDLKEDDALREGETIQPWSMLYRLLHGFPFWALISFLEFYFFDQMRFGLGWLLHLIYDLPTHHYPRKKSFCPMPFYPLVKWNWPWGLVSLYNLKSKDNFSLLKLIWFFHFVFLGLVLWVKYWR